MTSPVAIAGTAVRTGSGLAVDIAVREVARAALDAAGMELDAVDMVVTVASDVLDAGMGATRSGIAGAYGRELLTVPSSAGHAFAAAVAMIESGQAGTVLLAGWGAGTKFAEIDGRIVQADPFYARPLGADAAAMAALQAQLLFAAGRLDEAGLAAYGALMRRRAGREEGAAGVAAWLRPVWADGAVALVLTAEGGRVAVTDIGTAFRPYTPQPDEFDPAGWVGEAMARMAPAAGLVAVESAGPTASCEAAALQPILAGVGWALDDARVNASGGGAASYFGPATGLRQIACVAEALRSRSGDGIAVDLAGPIGQATTIVSMRGSGA